MPTPDDSVSPNVLNRPYLLCALCALWIPGKSQESRNNDAGICSRKRWPEMKTRPTDGCREGIRPMGAA